MERITALLERLAALGNAVAQREGTLGLLGLGSVGVERARIDAWSDLDFFLIVRHGFKQRFIHHLDWLEAAAPLGWSFQNTPDGHKILFSDGIYGEFAVFERQELPSAAYAEGVWVWRHQDLEHSLAAPVIPVPQPQRHDAHWMLGEILSNLYVGLCRFHRGEKMSGMTFVERHAFGMLLTLWEHTFPAKSDVFRDPFTPDRRLEQRFPDLAEQLPGLLQGYGRTPASALAMLKVVEKHWPVHPHIKAEIEKLAFYRA
jgi:hypothetical protein